MRIYCIVAVIEVSCGEYGDNIKTLVNAIRNGKHDIRDGYPFPEKEMLNNTGAKDSEAANADNGIPKDKNDANSVEEKFSDSKLEEKLNGGINLNYGFRNDILKKSKLIDDTLLYDSCLFGI